MEQRLLGGLYSDPVKLARRRAFLGSVRAVESRCLATVLAVITNVRSQTRLCQCPIFLSTYSSVTAKQYCKSRGWLLCFGSVRAGFVVAGVMNSSRRVRCWHTSVLPGFVHRQGSQTMLL